jgi:hypothetical protein
MNVVVFYLRNTRYHPYFKLTPTARRLRRGRTYANVARHEHAHDAPFVDRCHFLKVDFSDILIGSQQFPHCFDCCTSIGESD